MITLEGIAKHPGVAIAIAAVVDAKNGINGISHALLQEGLQALKKGLESTDYPEAIIACDNLALGAITKIPGINTIGIAAESGMEIPGLPVELPCVIGVNELLKSIAEGNLVIVDGFKGIVHIDPDPLTLVHYQQAEERRHLREKVFIDSEHIPARTQNGEVVLVYARLSDESQLDDALSAGADGLLYDLRGNHANIGPVSSRILCEAAGKPVVFTIDYGSEDILRAVMIYCTPEQVTLASDNTDLLASQVEKALDHIVLEALQLDLEVPRVNIGWILDASELDNLPESDVEPAVTIAKLDMIDNLVSAGVRRVAVEPNLIKEAKYAVRSIGLES